MGEQRLGERRTKGRASGRLWTIGTTGLLATVSLLMVLAPASAGAVHPAYVLKAPYKGSVSTPNSYSYWAGCASAKSVTTKWAPLTGMVTGSNSDKAVVCKKTLGGIGSSSYGSSGTGITIGIPFKVASTGNHSIGSAVSVTLAGSSALTTSGCPAKNVNYNPPLYTSSSAGCSDSTSLNANFYAYVVDATNTSWYNSNYSYAQAYNYTYWGNSTYCYNYGTPACSNTTGGSSYGAAYAYNAPGWTGFTWAGTTVFTMWTNGTNMVKTDKFVLVLNIGLGHSASVYAYNLLAYWAGSASASINMATLGNGATLSSITIS